MKCYRRRCKAPAVLLPRVKDGPGQWTEYVRFACCGSDSSAAVRAVWRNRGYNPNADETGETEPAVQLIPLPS